jgi:hypothetical protein
MRRSIAGAIAAVAAGGDPVVQGHHAGRLQRPVGEASNRAIRRPRLDIATQARIRAALVLAGLLTFVLAGGFFARLSWATNLWPWPAAPLSYVFIASILAAIAVPLLWIAVSGELAAMQAGSIDLAVMYGGMLVYIMTRIGTAGQPTLWPYAIVFGLACIASGVAFVWSRRIAWRDQRPMPGLVRGSFAGFAVILVAAGTALILHAAIFPWRLTAESSAMFGLIYLGAAVYFIHGFLRPRWQNAAGQLAGFLAYDLVLLAPFLEHFKVVHGGQLASLIVYTTFLVYTGALAIHYLFLHDETRIRVT